MKSYWQHNWKRHLVELLIIGICIVGAILWGDRRPVLSQAGQQVGQITMLPSTIPVDPKLEKRVGELLATKADLIGTWTYAITDVSDQDPYWVVSVAGLPDPPPRAMEPGANALVGHRDGD